MKEKVRNTGLTEKEQKVMDAILLAWNEFCALERQHPSELIEFAHGIHLLQDKLAVRIARREYPKGWPTYLQNKELENATS